ncbi:MAG TPA: tetratricopeptide repeat protein [Xanthomonadaceae bacterium]|nr:tetratricopeptide repeat protein [Xanthomonadaceae bacterium]
MSIRRLAVFWFAWLLLLSAQALAVQSTVSTEELLAAAERGDAAAQYQVALRYGKGEGVTRDQAHALHWLLRAAESGHLEAQANIGVLFTLEAPMDAQHEVGMRWLRRAAERRHPMAALQLGLMASEGGDPALALHWFRVAADSGDHNLQRALSDMLLNGEGVRHDLAEAYYWTRLAALSDPAGDTESRAMAVQLDEKTRAAIDARAAAWRPKLSDADIAASTVSAETELARKPASAEGAGAVGHFQVRHWDYPDEGVDAPPVAYFERWKVRDAIAYRKQDPARWEGREYIGVEVSTRPIERAGLAATLREQGRSGGLLGLILELDAEGELLTGLMSHSQGYDELQVGVVESTLRVEANSVRGNLRIATPESSPDAPNYRFEISIDAALIEVAPPADSSL